MSTVIKAHEAGPILRRLSTVDLADHLAEARSVVEAAQRRAAQIIAEAQRKAELALADAEKSGAESGRKRGYVEGTRQGQQDAYDESVGKFEREHAGIVRLMKEAVTAIEALKDDLMIAAQRDVLEFAALVATKLTFAVGKMNGEAARENLRRALRLVESGTDITIRVNPADNASIETFARSVLEQAQASRTVNLVPDESIAPGGCKVETERTRVDATLETQVDEMVALLLGGVPNDA